ncbi:Fe-S cluster assembly protein SufD [Ignavibacteria bacterium]|nr:Fe-S cluster assembly protein SufD [Bacteroidota bacterium]MCZ2133571.1 Fe-S cluster assembly protein SufD [Bacteroidota bacterium]
MENNDLHGKLLADFHQFEQTLNGGINMPFQILRREAAERFRALGFPTIRLEEWKYTNVMPLIKHDYTALPAAVPPVDAFPAPPDFIPENAVKIILINGRFSPDYSLPDAMPAGLGVSSFDTTDTETKNMIGKILDFSDNAFTALNTAFAYYGAVLKIADNANISQPITVLNYTDARDAAIFAQPRLFIYAGRNSQASIIEYSATIGEQPALVNSAIEIIAAENSSIRHYIIQDDTAAKITASHIRQAAASLYYAVTLTLGGHFVRNTAVAELAAPGAEAHFYGLALGSDKRLIDNHTMVDHAAPHCQSNEHYNHILDDRSTAVFNGKIYVRKGAQKTNAYQSNRTILMSGSATINSKPQLEIYADDVKCSHGATSGCLDETSLFYLRSRGISEEKAKALLLHAFAAEISNKIQIGNTRLKIDEIIAKRLHDEE